MQAKKLLILVGSHAGKSSHTLAFCENLAHRIVSASDAPVQVEALTADEWNIGPCVSCSSCFKLGYCARDAADEMATLRQKLMDCDALIVASPVYVLQVSSAMKLLIDRLGFWTHTMPLLGKPCCVAVTTSRSVGETARYLELIFSYMGCSVFPPLVEFRNVQPKNAPDLEQAQSGLAERMAEILSGKTLAPVTELARAQYARQSRLFHRMEKFLAEYPSHVAVMREFTLWQTQGYLPHDTIEAALWALHNTKHR